jgi:hypothetical protein
MKTIMMTDNNDDDSVTRISQSITPDAGEQSEGEKDKMDAGDIGEGYCEDSNGEGPLVTPFPLGDWSNSMGIAGFRVILTKQGTNQQ